MIADGEGLREFWFERVVEEDFVDDESQVVFGAEALQLSPLGGRSEVPCRVVGVNEGDGTGSRSDSPAECGEINMPAVIVKERVWGETDIADLGQEVEKWVAGLGNEDFVVRVAKQPEEVAVGFAGAGGEEHLAGVNPGAVVGLVGADGLAGAKHAARVRLVIEGGGS